MIESNPVTTSFRKANIRLFWPGEEVQEIQAANVWVYEHWIEWLQPDTSTDERNVRTGEPFNLRRMVPREMVIAIQEVM